MRNEIRNENIHDFVYDNYAHIVLADNSLLRDKEFEFLVNVYLKKTRLKKPPPDQQFYCRVCNKNITGCCEMHYQTCSAISYFQTRRHNAV